MKHSSTLYIGLGVHKESIVGRLCLPGRAHTRGATPTALGAG